jgi:anti-sigma-K factor RskA
MVGLLAAVSAAMSAVTGLAHGVLLWAVVVDAAAAAGLVAYLALPPTKKRLSLGLLAGLDAAQLALALAFEEA